MARRARLERHSSNVMARIAEQEPRLFVWRDQIRFAHTLQESGPTWDVPEEAAVYTGFRDRCPYCKNGYAESTPPYADPTAEQRGQSAQNCCLLCGFWFGQYIEVAPMAPIVTQILDVARLKSFGVNAPELALGELGAHLKRRFRDVYSLTPRRFEELVGDIYKSMGFEVRLTQQTRDGGYDIILLEHQSGNQTIVECKRYADTRTVGVGIVRQVLGVQLAKGIRTATIVTSTRFTPDAAELAVEVNDGVSGYTIELIDADALLKALNVYNNALPPLHLVDLNRSRGAY